jgi:glyoxylase-like metal-dependent hydrolase (beta-lactamase superfamily II)/rhodanese-related sulfurtransferase
MGESALVEQAASYDERSQALTADLVTGLEVVDIETPNLGDRSYVVGVGGVAVAIDPQRDIDRVLAVLADHGWTLTHVFETHLHNDYVSGGLELARVTGATYVVPALANVSFAAVSAQHGDEFHAGTASWRAVHTPGHTPHHTSFVVSVDGTDRAVFTGGSMLFGSVGRPDLLGPEQTLGLAHDQWHSVRRLGEEVAGDAQVMPTHGFGSFCSATETVGLASTVAEQRRSNPAFRLGQDEFVAELLAGLDAYPAYYAHMGPANASGPPAIDLSLPAAADPVELRRRIDAEEWVVDLRSRQVFAAGHLRGTLSFDVDGNAVTYLGWLLPWGTPVTLLGDSLAQVEAMQRDLARIGIDRPAAHAVGSPASWALNVTADVISFRRASFTELASAQTANRDLLVLDLRRNLEWADGHITGARHVPLHELPTRMDEVQAWSNRAAQNGTDATVWAYCGSGFRAAIGASLLERTGLPVVHVDQDFTDAPRSGAAITQPEDAALRLGPPTTA